MATNRIGLESKNRSFSPFDWGGVGGGGCLGVKYTASVQPISNAPVQPSSTRVRVRNCPSKQSKAKQRYALGV